MQEIELQQLKNLGFNLMPLQPKSKDPMGGTKWKRLQTERYDGAFPADCNVAVICGEISGRIFVVDLDDESLFKEFEAFHDTYIVKTGKGYHIYLKYNAFAPPNRKFDDARGRHIDIKSEGGYVLAAGSIHPSGKKYEVLSDLPIRTVNVQAVMTLLQKIGFDTEKRPIEDIAKGVGQGTRDSDTFKYLCYLIREKGLAGAALEKEAFELNARHKPPMPDDQVRKLIAQAVRYEGHNITVSEELLGMDELEAAIKEDRDLTKFIKQFGEELVTSTAKELGKSINTIRHVTWQEIKPDLEGIPIAFEGRVIAAGERMTYTKKASYQCTTCNATRDMVCDAYRKMSVPVCGKDKQAMEVIPETKVTDYIQQIRMQEFIEVARDNSPGEFNAEIIGENVGYAIIGSKYSFVGKFRSMPPKGEDYNDIVFDIMKMEKVEQDETCMPEKSEVERWESDPSIYERVRDSIAPELHLDPMVKETCMLACIGGTSLNGKRDRINIGLYGDAQMGKSELLEFLHKMIPGSGFTIGKQATAAGLTIGMIKLHDGTMAPKPGLFPLHNGKPVFWDEVDKATPDGRDAALEVMEQGRVTLTKSGSSIPDMRLPAECPLIDAGNPKNGKFNRSYPSIADNFVMTVPFITRHDLVWLFVDQNDPEVDEVIMNHIQDFKLHADKYMKMEELQRFFAYTSKIKATIPEELNESMKVIYRKLRPLNKQDSFPIGLRQFYGIHRLVTASAAAHLRHVATMDDVKIIEKIIFASLKSLFMNVETGEIEKEMSPGKQKRNDVFLSTWGKLQDDNKTVDKDEFLKILGQTKPFTIFDAEDEWNKCENRGMFNIDTDTGRYRLVSG